MSALPDLPPWDGLRVLAIDPGPKESAYVIWDGSGVINAEICNNQSMREVVADLSQYCGQFAIEKIASYGMAVGTDVFETCIAIGRFIEIWESRKGRDAICISRLDIKVHLCKSARAKDTNVRQALIDRFGSVGTKKHPGPLYGIRSHCWSALAVAVVAYDRLKCGIGEVFEGKEKH